MNSANTEWIAISTPPKPEDFPVWLGRVDQPPHLLRYEARLAELEWTHWMKAELPAPPARPKTLEEVDREAFNKWDLSTGGFGTVEGSLEIRRLTWLAARSNLRERHAAALKEFINSPAGMNNGIWVNREGFYKLTALLKGEQ